MNNLSFSIVTPSFNQAQYLEEAITSVINQNYLNLEYVIMDGGSNDGSVKIIEKYGGQLHHWKSVKDQGQFQAISDGFKVTNGEIMGWINSDDKYLPWAFSVVNQFFINNPDADWVSTRFPLLWGQTGEPIYCSKKMGFAKSRFMKAEYLPNTGGCLQQESTFWRRRLWNKAGGFLDNRHYLAGDFDLWYRFFNVGAKLFLLDFPIAGFRVHEKQKTYMRSKDYENEAFTVLKQSKSKIGLSCWYAINFVKYRWILLILKKVHKIWILGLSKQKVSASL